MNDTLLNSIDLVCFSHQRWNFVYQRPQHLLSRFSRYFRVFYIEDPIFHANTDRYDITLESGNIAIVVPHLQHGPNHADVHQRLETLLTSLFQEERILNYIFWYCSPAAISISRAFRPRLAIYDCMEEFSRNRFASREIHAQEAELLSTADLVFTSGYSLYESKKKLHPRVYPFPNSIDKDHFLHARTITFDPPDQQHIPHLRIGYYGVIDERVDMPLLERISRLRPHWRFIMVGPIVNVDPDLLPNFHNIHYLGSKLYGDLPHYLAGWDIAIIPFIRNESTRFINPAKTPEYLAAGKPVISTPINDVIRYYGNKGLVKIAGTPEEFVRVAEEELNLSADDRNRWLDKVDDFLETHSWDKISADMLKLIRTSLTDREAKPEKQMNVAGTITES